jgi:hypothetical protein
MRVRLAKLLALVVGNLLLTATCVEIALQGVHWARRRSDNPILSRIDARLQVKESWEEYFLQSYLTETSLVYAGIHRPHPTRGWAMKPSVTSSPEPGTRYTTNRQGYRALYDYANDPARYQVLIIGDSFTFGDEADDHETWPALLQAGRAELNVLNMGGTGYGVDQMLITLEEEIPNYRPKLVVCAFASDDLRRSTMTFRDYKKPMFMLRNRELVLTNTPIGDVDSVVDEIASRRSRFYSYSPLQIVNLVNGLLSDIPPIALDECSTACRDLNAALLDRMSAVATTHGADFLLVYIPWGEQIKNRDAHSYGEDFFQYYVGGRRVQSLDPRPELLKATFEKAAGHYMRNEAALLSETVMQKIETLDSWNSWMSSPRK